MKVKVINKGGSLDRRNYKFYEKFIKFLQTKFPLRNDVKIIFTKERIGSMTTGSRTPKNEMIILTKKRINRDILRTLAHEWVHEYQKTILKRPNGPNIGGVNEDEANAFAGRLMKIFEKKYPTFEEKMYE